ncbi:Protein of unknown function, partial [Gryllus bimaculatus]
GLELRWCAPLRSGGVLTTADERITRTTHGYDHVLYKRHLNINSNNHTYVHAVNVTLEEGQQYDVFVYFGTGSNKLGEEAHVAVWRPPSRVNVTSLTIMSLTKQDEVITDGENVTEAITIMDNDADVDTTEITTDVDTTVGTTESEIDVGAKTASANEGGSLLWGLLLLLFI